MAGKERPREAGRPARTRAGSVGSGRRPERGPPWPPARRRTHREDGVQPQQAALALLQGLQEAQQLALDEEALGTDTAPPLRGGAGAEAPERSPGRAQARPPGKAFEGRRGARPRDQGALTTASAPASGGRWLLTHKALGELPRLPIAVLT